MDRNLVEQARKGDREAFAVLVHQVSDSLYAEPADINVDGVDGEYVELTGPLRGCIEPQLWLTADGSCRCMDSRVERNRIWILEVDGRRLVIDALDVPPSDGTVGTSATDLAELQTIIDSIEISR